MVQDSGTKGSNEKYTIMAQSNRVHRSLVQTSVLSSCSIYFQIHFRNYVVFECFSWLFGTLESVGLKYVNKCNKC